MRVARRLVLVLLVVATSGCGSAEEESPLSAHLQPRTVHALERADAVELLVLGERLDEGGGFDDREVLATLPLERSALPAIRAHLGQALAGAGGFLLCYAPHHGLRLRQGDEVVELSICFHCAQMNEMGATPYPVLGGEGMHALRRDLDAIIEARTDYRFDEDAGPMGGWVRE